MWGDITVCIKYSEKNQLTLRECCRLYVAADGLYGIFLGSKKSILDSQILDLCVTALLSEAPN